MKRKNKKQKIKKVFLDRINRIKDTESFTGLKQEFRDLKEDLKRMARKKRPRPLTKEGQTKEDIKLFFHGKRYYDSLLRDISRAKERIYVETYIIRPDHTGLRIKKALKQASKRGVKVTLVYDYWGSHNLPIWFKKDFLESGVRILEFHPLGKLFRSKNLQTFMKRDHRKIAIIDDKTGYLGGMNISDDYTRWRDCQMRIKGPSVRHLIQAAKEIIYIIRNNKYYYSRKISLKLMEQLRIKGPVRILRDIPTILHQYIKREVLSMIKSSKRYVYITMAYFVPDRNMIYELIKASRRGVDVRIMLSKHSDVPLVQYASRTFYSRLMKNGIRIYEYIPTFNHQKTIVSDDLYSTIGSANLNSRSFRHDYEINAFMKDRSIALRLKRMFLEDQTRSREIMIDRWRKRRLKQKIIEKFCILFRQFI